MATTQVNLNTGYLPDRSAELTVGNSDNLWQVNENGWGWGGSLCTRVASTQSAACAATVGGTAHIRLDWRANIYRA